MKNPAGTTLPVSGNERSAVVDINDHVSLPSPISGLLQRVLKLDKINKVYQALPVDLPPEAIFEETLKILGVRTRVIARSDAPIPSAGPVLVVSNHPTGGLDGLLMGSTLVQWRPDVRFMANYLLHSFPEMKEWVIPVDPFGGADSVRANLKGMRAALHYLKEGGCLGATPSGEVAHWGLKSREITESPWSPHLASIARKTEATVVPFYIHANNSILFHLLGLLNPRLRTMRLPAEMLNKKESVIDIVVGDPISPRKLKEFKTGEDMSHFLRLQTILLRGRLHQPGRKWLELPWGHKEKPEEKTFEPIVEPIDPELLRQDIAALPEDALMVEKGRFQVYCAEAGAIPHVLEEIARVREVTFRAAHEGTGKSKDLDRFDQTYLHLFLWDKESRAIAGAYRMGLSDQLLEAEGRHGLYTDTLFLMDPGFLESIQPAIELGRSFITPDYQKKHATLILLWKGIGAFLVRHPRYRHLFGPVSIDKEYQSLSKDVIVQFLSEQKGAGDLSQWIRARHPLRLKSLKKTEKSDVRSFLNDIDQVSAVISEIEDSGKGVPILLRHYVKLNARLLAFNVDPDFNDSVDSLMICELPKADPKLLSHYMGKGGARAYLEEHSREPFQSPG